MSSKKREAAVKVVLMDTQYVETDPMSFKSVVQKLTGKDCSVAWIKESNSSSSSASSASASSAAAADAKRGVISVEVDKMQGDDVVNGNNEHHVTSSKGMSFEDLDRLISEQSFLLQKHYFTCV